MAWSSFRSTVTNQSSYVVRKFKFFLRCFTGFLVTLHFGIRLIPDLVAGVAQGPRGGGARWAWTWVWALELVRTSQFAEASCPESGGPGGAGQGPGTRSRGSAGGEVRAQTHLGTESAHLPLPLAPPGNINKHYKQFVFRHVEMNTKGKKSEQMYIRVQYIYNNHALAYFFQG